MRVGRAREGVTCFRLCLCLCSLHRIVRLIVSGALTLP